MNIRSRQQALRQAVGNTVRGISSQWKSRNRLSAAAGRSPVIEQLEDRRYFTTLPVAWFKYDEGSGSTAYDSSANHTNATLASGASFTNITTEATGALSVTTSSGYATSSDASLPMGDTSRSMALWFNTSSLGTATTYGLAGYGTAATNEAFGLQVAKTGSSWYLKFGAYNNSYTGSIALTANAWNHLAVTFDGTTATLYVNGTADTAHAETLSTTGGSLYAGSFLTTYAGVGKIDDFRVYDRALSSSEVAALASPPATPVVTAVSTDGQVALSWASVSGASTYNVYRSNTANGEGATPYQTGVTTNSYTDTALTDGTRYYYRVSAVNSGGIEGAASTEVSGWPHASSTPVAYYKYDDGSGSTATDSSGNGENGTLASGATWTTTARVGSGAISYNGYSYTTSADADLPMGNSARTLALWYNTSTLGSNTTYGLAGWGNASANQSFGLSLTKVSSHWYLQFSNDGTNLTGAIALTANAWNHLAVTFDGSTVTLYVNGVADITGSYTLATAGGNFKSGTYLSNNDPGKIDDLRVYDRALSASEIAQFLTAPALTVLSGNGENSLNWGTVTGAISYNVYRSTTLGGEGTTPFATGVTGNHYVDTAVTAGTTYYYFITAVSTAGEGLTSTECSATPGTLPSGWSDGDIGSPVLAGAAKDSSGAWTVTGNGSNIYGTSDQLHYAYTSLTGDGQIIAEVNSQQNTGTYSKAGIMFRAGTAANAAWVMLSQNGGNISFEGRTSAGASAQGFGAAYGVSTPIWLKLTRIGNVFSAYTSTNGTSWTKLGSETVALSSALDVGLAVDSYTTNSLNMATFSNVVMTPGTPAPDAPTNIATTALSETAAQINWTGSLGATGYTIWRSDNGGTPHIVTTVTASTTSYVDTGLSASDNAAYTVTANDAAGTSLNSSSGAADTGAVGTDSSYTVTLGTGFVGSTACTDSGTLTATQDPVEAANPQDAIELAVSGSMTSDVDAVVPGGGTVTYNFSVGNDHTSGAQSSAFVVRMDNSADHDVFNDATQGGLNQNSDGSFGGYVALEDLYDFQGSSDNDYNDYMYPVTVTPAAPPPPGLNDQVSPSSHQTVDIHGVPLPDPSPTGQSDKDRVPNMSQEDMYTLTPSYTTTDIAVPMPSGDLTLAFRRTETVGSLVTQTTGQDPNGNHQWDSQYILGLGWSTNLGSRIVLNYDPHPQPGHYAYTATVFDDVGNAASFASNDGVNFGPDVVDSFANASLKNTLQWTGSGFVYHEEHGSTLYFSYVSTIDHSTSATPPTESYFRLTKITDANGNELDYSYSSSGDGTLVSSIADAATPGRFLDLSYTTYGSGEYRLASVTGPLNGVGGHQQVFTYQYGGDLALLTSVTKPPVLNPGSIGSESPTYYSPKVSFTYQTIENEARLVFKSDGSNPWANKELITWVMPASITDANNNGGLGGNQTTFAYTTSLEPTSIELSGGQPDLTWEYKPILSSVTTADGTATFAQVSRDSLGNAVTTVTDTKGDTFTYTFTAALTPAPTALGFAIVVDQIVRAVPVTDVDGNTSNTQVTFNYSDDIDANLTSVVDVSGNTTTYAYGTLGDELNGQPSSQTEGGLTTQYFYDSTYHKLIEQIDPTGKITDYTLDSAGNILSMSDAHGTAEQATTTYTYDGRGFKISQTDPDGRVTDYIPDSNENLQYTIVKGYSGENLTPLATSSAYPSIDPSHQWIVTEQVDDIMGNVLESFDANGNETTNQYDNWSRLTATTPPAVMVDGTLTTATSYSYYDYNSNLLEQVDQNGNVTTYTYDALNRRTSMDVVMNDSGGSPDLVTHYGYDAVGDQTSVTDPRGNTTSDVFDALLRQIEMLQAPVTIDVNPDSTDDSPATTTQQYITKYYYGTNAGDGAFLISSFNPTRVVDPNGYATDTVYNSAYQAVETIRRGELATAVAAGAAPEAGDLVTQTTYNGANQPIEVDVHDTNSTGAEADHATYTFYDDMERPTVKLVDMTGSGAGLTPGAIVDDSSTFTVPTGDLATRTTYDLAGQVIDTTDANGNTTQMVYDGDGRLIKTILPAVSTYTVAGGTSTVAPTTTTVYDGNSNAILATDANGNQTQNTYDARNRQAMSILDLNGNGVFDPTQGAGATDIVNITGYDLNGNKLYTIDPNGNRTDITYDAANRPIETQGPAVADGDDGGAMTRPTTTIAYNLDGKVASAADPRGIVTTTTYDELDRPRFVTTNAAASAGSTDQLVSESRYDADGNVLASVKDNWVAGTESPQVTSYVYDAFDRKVSQTQPDPDGSGPETSPVTTYQYDQAGNQTSVTDSRGNTTNVVYDLDNRKVQMAQPSPDGVAARPTTYYAYDNNGNLTGQTDPNGNTTNVDYDALNRKVEQIQPSPDGVAARPTTLMAYDAVGNMTGQTDPRGNLTSSVFDAGNRKIEQVQPSPDGVAAQPTTHDSFDADGNLIAQTDPNGHTTNFQYDALNRKTETLQPSPDGVAARPTTLFSYDLIGNLVGETDPNGNTTNSVYDGLNRKITEIQPSPDGVAARPTTSYVFDPLGNLLGQTDPLGHTTNYVYDNLNRKIEEIQPSPDGIAARPTTLMAYDADGNLTGQTDPNGHTTNYVYDNLNRKSEEIEPSPDGIAARPTTAIAYDADGNQTSTTDPLGNTTRYAYDNLNRKIQQTDPDPDGSGPLTAPVTSYAYDADGNQTGVTDPNGNTTNTVYDNLNRQTEVIQPSPDGVAARPTTIYAYDPAGNELSETDPDGNVTSYVYDNISRQTTQTTPLGTSLTGYDAAGNVTSTTDRNGRVVDFGYDHLERKTDEQWLDTLGSVTRTTTWTYDAKGLQTEVADPDATYSYLYDNLDRPITLTLSLAGMSTPVILTETYDAAGNRTSLAASVNGTPDLLNSYGYNNLNDLTQIQQGSDGGNAVASKQADFSYNANQQVTGTSLYSDLTGTNRVAASTDGYDLDNLLTSLDYALGTSGSSTLDYGFVYDAGSRMTSQTNSDGTTNYTYDHDNQLTSASLTGESYTYDAAGNRTTDGSNTVTTGTDNEIASDGTYDYTYDNEGNLLTKTAIDGSGSTDYMWDSRNRLSKVTMKNGSGTVTQTIDYGYDDNNDRISQTVTDGTGTVTLNEKYVYDGAGNLLLVLDGSTGNVTERYLNGDSEDQTIAAEVNITGSSAGDTRWALTDQQGSVRDVVDNSATVLDHIHYDSYGNLVSQTNASDALRIGYTGMQEDTLTGLDYDHARYYSPTTGTFLSQDPKGFKGGDRDANLYRYVNASPLDGTDPTGMDDQSSNDDTTQAQVQSQAASLENDGQEDPGENDGDQSTQAQIQSQAQSLENDGQDGVGSIGTAPDGSTDSGGQSGCLLDDKGNPIQLASTDPNAALAAVAGARAPVAVPMQQLINQLDPQLRTALAQIFNPQNSVGANAAAIQGLTINSHDALILLHLLGYSNMARTAGYLKGDSTEVGYAQAEVNAGKYANLDAALAARADDYNNSWARIAILMNSSQLLQLYARLLVPTANLVAIGVMGPGAVGAAQPIVNAGTGGMLTGSVGETAGISAASAHEMEAEGVLSDANYAQTTYSEAFSNDPDALFPGKTINDMSDMLKSGDMNPNDVPIQYIVRDGNKLILNTRSAQALERAGIPRSQWNAVDMTGDAAAEARLTGQLQRNGLTSQGTPTVQSTGK